MMHNPPDISEWKDEHIIAVTLENRNIPKVMTITLTKRAPFELAYRCMTDDEKAVLALFYGVNPERMLHGIGALESCLGIPDERIRELLLKAQTKVYRALRYFHLEIPPEYTHIIALDFSVRVWSILMKAGINTAEILVEWSDAELLELRNFSQRCLEEVRGKVPHQ